MFSLRSPYPDLRDRKKNNLRDEVKDAVGVGNGVKVWDRQRCGERGGSKMDERTGREETTNGVRVSAGEPQK